MCGPPASEDGWVEPGTLHVATLTGLKPDTVYFYQYGQVLSLVPTSRSLLPPSSCWRQRCVNPSRVMVF